MKTLVPATHASQARFREVHGKYDHSHVLVSDDLGLSWRVGGIAATGTNEATLAELPGGHILLNARNLIKRPGGERVLQLSNDSGA